MGKNIHYVFTIMKDKKYRSETYEIAEGYNQLCANAYMENYAKREGAILLHTNIFSKKMCEELKKDWNESYKNNNSYLKV